MEHTDEPVPRSSRHQAFDHDDDLDYEPLAKDKALKGFVKHEVFLLSHKVFMRYIIFLKGIIYLSLHVKSFLLR